MIHTSIGLYANGDFKINGVISENLAGHIKYNRMFRPGRALIVDGHCVLSGMVSPEVIGIIENNFENGIIPKQTKDTAKYQ